MSRTVVALVILALALTFAGVHTHKILAMDQQVSMLCDATESAYQEENWTEVLYQMGEIEKVWNENRFWACMTIETDQIEEIEVSFQQSKIYAGLGAKEDFIGEFTMFRMLLQHLPHHEGFSAEEIL